LQKEENFVKEKRADKNRNQNGADLHLEKLNMMFLYGAVGFLTAHGVSVSSVGMSRKL